ncbi:MAG: hypothetical protein K0U64_04265 [Actinomycetia bacterium]|nr:hypothetical protein [Actinomycetes bacterium]
MLQIGDIGVTEHWVVTPNGTAPLRGTRWLATDNTRVQERIPTTAIVLAIVFAFFCLLGLLFLLMKEQYVTGYVEVRVTGEDLDHWTQVPVFDVEQVVATRALVSQAQALAHQ